MADSDSTSTPFEMEGETPSPLCNHLLEQARLLMSGELEANTVKEGVASALDSLEQAREQTLNNLENDDASDELMEAFERSFEEMQLALEDLDELCTNPTDESYEGVKLSLYRAASATVFAMSTLQQSQLDGPTDMPLFNALVKMKNDYLEGGVEADELKDALANIVDMTKKAIDELLQAEGEQPPQRDGLVRAYKEQIESLELAGETVESGNKDQLEAVFQKLLLTSNGVKEAMGSLNLAIMSQGPCRLERTNVLLSAAETFQAGGIGPDEFSLAIEAFENQLREESAAVEEMASVPHSSASLDTQIDGVREAYEMHEDAMALFAEVLEGEAKASDFEKAKKLLIEASEKLSDHKEALIEIGETEGKISCVRCGAKNEPGSRVCNSCGAQLPQQAGTGPSTMSYQESDGAAVFGGELVVTTNLEKLFNAINEIAEERSTDQEFEAVLVWMDGLLVKAQQTMPEVPDLTPPPGASEEAVKHIETVADDLHDQRAMMLGGMADLQAALGTLHTFFETRSNDTLTRGVKEVRDAAVKMQQAETALTLLSEAVEEAAQKASEEAKTGEE